ncbi:MAG: DUF2075 domain-containing protein [Lachnospiraceae bacterium]|nr:DUF2075 domain-containing protein [Lachnospiraceae bacterium]
MFEIRREKFWQDTYGNAEYLNNWPMVYILENGKKAYVGQSNNVQRRMAQHKMATGKQEFTDVHFIYSDKFNQSATFDYESRLISLMAADEKFCITNANAGVVGANYYKKNEYDNDFRELWRRLQEQQLVKHSIEELEHSDLFKYSPFKKLSDDQRNVVRMIMQSLRISKEQRIIINGMPGSGKTVIAVYLFKLFRDTPEYADKKIALVIPQTSLRKTIKDLFKNLHGLAVGDVIGPNEVAQQTYDILLVDEAHRLKQRKNLSSYMFYDECCRKMGLPKDATQLDWVMEQSKCTILFYDQNQVVGPSGIEMEQLNASILQSRYSRMYTYYQLLSQMRCKGGTEYINYVKDLLHNNVKNRVRFEAYEFRLVDAFGKFEELYRRKLMSDCLTRMVSGYAWEWKSKNDSLATDIVIDNVGKRWNSTLANWVHSPKATEEVGCIHSIQGYDLDYGFVILGNDIKYDKDRNEVIVDRVSYFDRYGKIGASDSQLKEFILNVYYVLMTRGIKGTYVYVCDDNLREYMRKYMDS